MFVKYRKYCMILIGILVLNSTYIQHGMLTKVEAHADSPACGNIVFNSSALTGGADLTAAAALVNNSQQDVQVVCIIALYDNRHCVNKVTVTNNPVEAGKTDIISGKITLPEKIDDGYYAKAFIWDSISNMKALAAVTSLTTILSPTNIFSDTFENFNENTNFTSGTLGAWSVDSSLFTGSIATQYGDSNKSMKILPPPSGGTSNAILWFQNAVPFGADGTNSFLKTGKIVVQNDWRIDTAFDSTIQSYMQVAMWNSSNRILYYIKGSKIYASDGTTVIGSSYPIGSTFTMRVTFYTAANKYDIDMISNSTVYHLQSQVNYTWPIGGVKTVRFAAQYVSAAPTYRIPFYLDNADIYMDKMPTMKGPVTFASAGEIAAARENIYSTTDPWKSAWTYSLAQANAALTADANCPSFPPAPDTNQFAEQWNPAINAGLLAKYSAFAYQMTGYTPYADKARQILLSWAAGWQDPYSDPSNDTNRGIWIGRPAASFCYAYSLIYDYLSSSDRSVINATMAIWMNKIKTCQALWLSKDSYWQQYWSNHYSGQNLGIIAIGTMIGDAASVNYAVSDSANPRNVQKMIQGAIYMAGDTLDARDPALTDAAPEPLTGEIYDRFRIVEDNKGFGYAKLHLNHLIDIATIMYNNGTDLFSYTAPTGENLRLAIEQYAEYYIAQDAAVKSGFYWGTDYSYDNSWGGMFETGHKRYPSSAVITEAVAKGPRTSESDNETYGKTEVLLRGEAITQTYPTLTGITVNGTSVDGFSTGKYLYDCILADGTTVIPTVTATSTYATVVTQATKLPGLAKIVVTNAGITSNYYVKFDFSQPDHGNKLTISSAGASTGDAALTVDTSTNEKWENTGSQWLQYDLGSAKTISYVAIATTKGQLRKANYTIDVSTDNTNWTNVYTGTSRGFTWNFEFYRLPASTTARYVRITANGYTENEILYNANSISEVNIYK